MTTSTDTRATMTATRATSIAARSEFELPLHK